MEKPAAEVKPNRDRRLPTWVIIIGILVLLLLFFYVGVPSLLNLKVTFPLMAGCQQANPDLSSETCLDWAFWVSGSDYPPLLRCGGGLGWDDNPPALYRCMINNGADPPR